MIRGPVRRTAPPRPAGDCKSRSAYLRKLSDPISETFGLQFGKVTDHGRAGAKNGRQIWGSAHQKSKAIMCLALPSRRLATFAICYSETKVNPTSSSLLPSTCSTPIDRRLSFNSFSVGNPIAANSHLPPVSVQVKQVRDSPLP
jgi:hypothetical protein